MTPEDRVSGVLLGFACGDALGRPVEFRGYESLSKEFGELSEMIGHGTNNQHRERSLTIQNSHYGSPGV